MKSGISNFLEEISSLSHSVVFLYLFALITEEGFLISPCYTLELCIQMLISFHYSAIKRDGFPSGQRGQTVNLLQIASVVRIHHHPLSRRGGTGRRTGLKILRDLPPVPVRFRSPALYFYEGNVEKSTFFFMPMISKKDTYRLNDNESKSMLA